LDEEEEQQELSLASEEEELIREFSWEETIDLIIEYDLLNAAAMTVICR